jgi:putative transposase
MPRACHFFRIQPKEQAIQPRTPLTLAQARQVVGEFVDHYSTVRLHSAIGYVTPKGRLENRQEEIFAARDQKLAAARENRKMKR